MKYKLALLTIVLVLASVSTPTLLIGLANAGSRDVAIIDVIPFADRVYVGRTMNINVTVTNKGDQNETFTVTVYYNITAGDTVGIQTVTDLVPGENRTLTFVWGTTGVAPCRNYTITAVAATVPYELDTADNTFTDGIVHVKMLGDINGDNKVRVDDIYTAVEAFATDPTHPRWNPEADINDDGQVRVDDILAIALLFGQTCPS